MAAGLGALAGVDVRGALALLTAAAALLTAGLALDASPAAASNASGSLYWASPTAGKVGRAVLGPIGEAIEGSYVYNDFIEGLSPGPVAVAADAGHVYWSNGGVGDAIGRAKLDPSEFAEATELAPNFIENNYRAVGLAVDTEHIYWAEDGDTSGGISRAHLDGTDVERGLVVGLNEPQGLAADSGHLYWASPNTGYIGRSTLDGGEATEEFIAAHQPEGVAVDTEHIYWTNAATGTIGRAKLNATAVEEEFVKGLSEPLGVAVMNGFIFWTSGTEIGRAKADGTHVEHGYLTGLSHPNLIAAVSALSKPGSGAGAGGGAGGVSGTVSAGSSAGAPPVVPLGVSVSPVQTPLSPRYKVFTIESTGFASSTTISIDGGQPIMHVNPVLTPYLGLRLADAGPHVITATSDGFGGLSVSSSVHVVFLPGSVGLKNPGFLPDVAVVSSSLREIGSAINETAAINRECVPGSTVVFGVAEATGCFKHIYQEAEIPAADRSVAKEYLADNLTAGQVGRHSRGLHPGSAESLPTMEPVEMPFVSTQPIHLDGMTITPRPGASVVVFPAISRVVSSNARVSYDGSAFGSIPVQTGALNLDLSSGIKRFTDGDEALPLFHFNTSEAFKEIGGFPIDGDVQVFFKKVGDERFTSLVVNVSLPEEIRSAAQADPTAQVEVNADNSRGTYLNHLNIHMNEAFLGPIELANVDFTYDDGGNAAEGCPRKWWKATAEVFFLPVDEGEGTAGVKLAPEPQRNGVAFCAGKFHSAGAALKFGYPIPPPEIFPGVTLNEIAFDIQLADPALFDGSATIKSAELVTATGGFLSVFASPGHPYTIKAGDAGGTLKGLVGQTYESPTVAIGGTVTVEPFPEVGLELGGAYLLYSYPDFVAARGYAHLQTFLFTINAEGSLELSTRTRRFRALAKGEICLVGGIEVDHVGLCAGGEARVSGTGISVCFNIADGTWTPGVGYRYGESLPEFFTGLPGYGCKPSRFWGADVRAARVSAVAPITFTVKRGEKAKTVRLTGDGGAPEVILRTPGGETITSQANQMFHSGHLSAISANKYKTTWVGVEDGKPGTYQIVSQPGSPAITGMAETRYEPEAGVSGKLTHRGGRYVLHYNAGHAAGQKVTFIERGKTTDRALRTVSGGKGTIAFEPALGVAGRREVVAEVEVDGIPGPPQTLARFSAPPPPRAGAVNGVRATRSHGAIAIAWRKAAFAKSYSVIVRLRSAGVRTLQVKSSAHSVRLPGVQATESGTVEVVAFGPLGDRGHAGRGTFKALRREPTRLLSFKELGTGAAT